MNCKVNIDWIVAVYVYLHTALECWYRQYRYSALPAFLLCKFAMQIRYANDVDLLV